MKIQIIKSIEGKAEYVLLPIHAYQVLKIEIDKTLEADYEAFSVEDYLSNPVALARIHANMTQAELADQLNVSQAYISKLEAQTTVSAKCLAKVMKAIKAHRKK